MSKFNTSIFAAAALVASLALSGTAFAVIPDAPAPKAGPTTNQPGQAMPSADYEATHKGAAAVITKFKTALESTPEVKAALAQLPVELAKLPALEKAFVDAKHAGNDAAAKTAQDNYAAEVKTIIGIALPLDKGIMPMRARIVGGFEQMGPVGAQLKAEKDIAALLSDIDTILKPLDQANEIVGPIHDAAVESAQKRIEAEGQRIFDEELSSQVGNALSQKVK